MIISSGSVRRRLPSAASEASSPTPVPRRAGSTDTATPAQSISLARRLRDWKTILSFAVSAGIVFYFVLAAHLDVGQVWKRIKSADPKYIVLALAVYYGSFFIRGLRWRLLLSKAGLRATLKGVTLGRLIEMILLSWFVNCLVPAKMGDAYRAYLLKNETGADMSLTLGTVVGERIADVLALVILLVGSGLLVLGTLAGANNDMLLIVLVGAGLACAIIAGVSVLRLASGRLSHLLPAK